MAPTWLDFGPQDGPKLGPNWVQNRAQNGSWGEVGSGIDFEPSLGRFLIDSGPIFGGSLHDFGSLLMLL